ncbi:endogenous retrovirus group K member 7 Gag polyprotein-like [Nannospalax galili]|uniref:endogenous retrovirus group K member 7 Gag polyprotein-like n=1 Tax=Nannospalax galili TaxID=1026970 RepID=UPI000819D64E|nr:endogenous retrovirus group K member 7 Gag polyprotein-like [Nannospalax galili]
MGSTLSKEKVKTALLKLLKKRGIRLKNETVQKFLDAVAHHAPWFLEEGYINSSSWGKLGEDLKRVDSPGVLPPGALAIWTLVQSCLGDASGKFEEDIVNRAQALEELQEEISQQAEGSSVSNEEVEEKSCSGEEEELGEGDLESLFMRLEVMGGRSKEKRRPRLINLGDHREDPLPSPSAPPGYPDFQKGGGPLLWGSGRSYNAQTWAKVTSYLGAFPVFQDQNNQRIYEPLDWKIIQRLKESISTYGTQAAYTITQVESLQRNCMTPFDWQNLCRAVLSEGAYLNWKAAYLEYCVEQAATNAANGQPAWRVNMLMGQGNFVNQQTGYPVQVYNQINEMVVKAWKMLSGTGDLGSSLSKVLQGPNEPFSDFLARLVETASRVFPNVDAAMPLVKQLAYEQANKPCRDAIRPYKQKTLDVWIKVCRDINETVIQGQALAAAIVTGLRGGPLNLGQGS